MLWGKKPDYIKCPECGLVRNLQEAPICPTCRYGPVRGGGGGGKPQRRNLSDDKLDEKEYQRRYYLAVTVQKRLEKRLTK